MVWEGAAGCKLHLLNHIPSPRIRSHAPEVHLGRPRRGACLVHHVGLSSSVQSCLSETLPCSCSLVGPASYLLRLAASGLDGKEAITLCAAESPPVSEYIGSGSHSLDQVQALARLNGVNAAPCLKPEKENP